MDSFRLSLFSKIERVLCPVDIIATRPGMPALTRLRVAVRGRSCNSRPEHSAVSASNSLYPTQAKMLPTGTLSRQDVEEILYKLMMLLTHFE